MFLLFGTASLQGQLKSEKPEQPDSYLVEEENIVDQAHANLSKGVLATANWLDSFFDDRRFQIEANETRIKTGFSTLIEKGEGLDFDVKANVRLRLPRFKNKLHLLVLAEPDDENTTARGLEQRSRNQIPNSDERSFAAALQYFFKETPLRNLSLLAGLKVRSGIPVGFLGSRYRQTIEVVSWTTRFTQSLRWFTDDGWEARTLLDFEKPLLDKLFFRTTAEGIWRQEKDGYFYNLKLLLFQPLSEIRSLSYEWNHLFRTQPNNRLEEINLGIRYRERIWRKWLFYEVGPQFSFPQEKDYDFVLRALFKLDVILGHY